MSHQHDKLVNKISNEVGYFYKNKIPFHIYRGGTNSTRVISFEKDKMIDIRKLNCVLKIDKDKKVAIVEPNVCMDQLVKMTLAKGLIPPVVMEFPGITVAGGVQGGAGESSSYKYGTFNSIVNWYEIILADGNVIRVFKDRKSDLYWGTAGSYGTLGIIATAEINLIEARRYVEVEYIPVRSFKEALDVLENKILSKPDYIDGIMYSKKSGVIIIGNLTNDLQHKKVTFTKARDEWFYLHAKNKITAKDSVFESIPIYDYLFRYDRGGFWMGEFSFNRFNMPFNRFSRWALNPLMKARKMYSALQASGVSQECIIQDISIPINNANKFLEYIDNKFGIYPLWLCPLKPDESSVFLPNHLDTKLVMNVGIWGKFNGSYDDFIKANRDLEKKVVELKGKKCLYAQSFYKENEFWQIYGSKHPYDSLRQKYKASYLPSIYDKVIVTKKYKISGKRGVLFASLGLDGINKK